MAEVAPRKVFRQRGATVAGVLGLAVCLLLLILTIVDGAWGWALVALGAAAIVLAVLVLPAVVLAADGVEIRNIVRSIRFTWPAIDVVESRWNLKVFTADDKGYGSWAVASQRSKPQGTRQSMFGAGLGAGGVKEPVGGDAPLILERPGSAGAVASEIRRAQQEHEMLVKRGTLPAGESTVRVRPLPLGLVLVIGGSAAIALGLILA